MHQSYVLKPSTRIKLIQKVTAAIDVTIGTEQGHPIPPELFKIFTHDLSENLSKIDELNAPLLTALKLVIYSGLMNDDLVLSALDAKSLQNLLDSLHDYADTWELSVYISKTNVMVLNSCSRVLECAYGFNLGSLNITPVRNYCYLGIQFSLNGTIKQAIEELSKKALRMINTSALTTSTVLKLINALIKPVATYGCPIWLLSNNVIKALLSPEQPLTLPKADGKNSLETTHLKMLKWIVRIRCKSSNNFCYGHTGRTPWAICVIPQCIPYYFWHHRLQVAVSTPCSPTPFKSNSS